MGQVLHGSATTTAAIRRAIQHNQESLSALAARYGINQKNVARWRHRSSTGDLPTDPRDAKSTVRSFDEEAIIVAFRRLNPAEAHIMGSVPDLRIIDDQLWAAVQGRLFASAAPQHPETGHQRFWEKRRLRHLLSGKIVCGVCDGPFSSYRAHQHCCNAAKRGLCDNGTAIKREALEARALTILAEHSPRHSPPSAPPSGTGSLANTPQPKGMRGASLRRRNATLATYWMVMPRVSAGPACRPSSQPRRSRWSGCEFCSSRRSLPRCGCRPTSVAPIAGQSSGSARR